MSRGVQSNPPQMTLELAPSLHSTRLEPSLVGSERGLPYESSL